MTKPIGSVGKRVAGIGCVMILAALVAFPAAAAPSGTTVTVSAGGQEVPSGGIASAGALTIAVHGTSDSPIGGLNSVKLEAKQGSAWQCIKQWSPSDTHDFSASYTWDNDGSYRWPAQGCSGKTSSPFGDITSNSTLSFQVTVHDSGNDATQKASTSVKLNNAPSRPDWSADPDVEIYDDGPVVTLVWDQNPEPDVVEYRVFRTDPAGGACAETCELDPPVNADSNDCAGASCTYADDSLPSTGYSGTYRYRVLAFRSSPSTQTKCEIPAGGNCIGSAPSGEAAAEVEEPPSPTPSPSETPGPSPSATPRKRPTGRHTGNGSGRSDGGTHVRGVQVSRDYSGVFTGPYKTKLPYSGDTIVIPDQGARDPDTTTLAAPVGSTQESRGILVPIAFGLLLFLGAAHIGRLLAGPERGGRPGAA